MNTHGTRPRGEAGYAAILVAVMVATVFLPLAAIGVDIARWYVEVQRVQTAADSAALAGVTFMPGDFAKAGALARETAALNGYAADASTTISVSEGDRPSQLRVSISSRVGNGFGATFGLPFTTITRSAVADYTAPAPMGSPCNTFGNEPPSQPGAAQPTDTALPAGSDRSPNCTQTPQFWAAVEGPSTDKVQGDRYGTQPCGVSGTYGCAADTNSERRPEGYFFAVHVEPAAVGSPIDVQAYDPAYLETGVSCGSIRQGSVLNRMSAYTTTDGFSRYDNASSVYCSGDYNPGGTPGTPLDTTFLMREQTDTGNPLNAAVIPGCTRQFRGQDAPFESSASALRQWTGSGADNTAFNPGVARVFHQWVSLCTFTPTRSGDYYLQVRTNVALGGSPEPNLNATGRTLPSVTYSGNGSAADLDGNTTAGVGLNSFSLRAVPSNSAHRNQVAIAGAARMPILQNASSSTAVFNLIRALPQAKGQYISFNFYDAADGSTSSGGTVTVLPPGDATGAVRTAGGIPGCRGAMNDGGYAALTGCRVNVRSSTHNGQLQRIIIPLPNDYECDPATLGGCWFRVQVSFAGSNVTDFTTWDANIGGDPVRLVE